MAPKPGSPLRACEPEGVAWALWGSLIGEEPADSLLTGEMSLLLLVWLTDDGFDMEAGFSGICQEGILGTEGDAGNCLLGGRGRWRWRKIKRFLNGP